jgi:hypothetical protein
VLLQRESISFSFLLFPLYSSYLPGAGWIHPVDPSSPGTFIPIVSGSCALLHRWVPLISGFPIYFFSCLDSVKAVKAVLLAHDTIGSLEFSLSTLLHHSSTASLPSRSPFIAPSWMISTSTCTLLGAALPSRSSFDHQPAMATSESCANRPRKMLTPTGEDARSGRMEW